MNKFYVIYDIQQMVYLKGLTKEEYTPRIQDAGSWSTKESAENWIRNIKGKYFNIIAMYHQWGE